MSLEASAQPAQATPTAEQATPASQAAQPAAAIPAEGAQATPADATNAEVKPTETPPVEAAKDPANPEEAKPTETPVVPEKYDFKLSEGSYLKDADLEEIASLAKERGLTQEQADQLVKERESVVGKFAESQVEALKTQVAQWKTEASKDPELGGANFTKNVELAKRVVDKFGDSAFKQALTETGLGDHPGLTKMLFKIGRAMGESSFVLPTPAANDIKKTVAERLYPSQPK